MTDNRKCDSCGEEITEANLSLHKASMCKACFEYGLNHDQRRALRLAERRMAKKLRPKEISMLGTER